MGEPDVTSLAFWTEHRNQLRQSENQRATLTNYVLVITAALSGLIVQQKFALATLPLSILITVIGGFGAVATAKYHERAEYHLQQARAITKAFKAAGALAGTEDLVKSYRENHYKKFPWLYRVRLHQVWTGLHLGIAAYGVGLLLVTTL